MSGGAALTREQVVAVYRQLLDRLPSEEEVAHQLATLPTLEALLRVALDSDEYAARLAAEHGRRAAPPATVANVFHPELAAWGHPPGTRSPDGDAVVGQAGWLFLCGGTNANLGQYVGEVPTDAGWLPAWRELMRRRDAEARALGATAALLVVPEKLAVYEERYPDPLVRSGPRPVERLLAAGDVPLLYPLAQLRAAAEREPAYLRTDTHLTFHGNAALFEAVRGALGVEAPPGVASLSPASHLIAGDLGAKFDPPVVEVVTAPRTFGDARVVEDNRAEIAAVGGHVGTRRVLANERAPDARVAVVFGDSFGFPADHYHGVAWWLAQVFRETHFVWVPFGWDPAYVRAVGAEVVLMEGAERFAAQVPRPVVDVGALAEETLGRKQGAGSAFR